VTPPIRTRPDGTKYPIKGGGGGGVGGVLLAIAAVAVLAGGGGALGLGSLGGGAGGVAAGGLPGNLAGDVVDSLPGRDLATRKEEGRKSAQRGKSDEAWSRLKLKELKRKFEHRVECVSAASGKVREFLVRTPCTSLDGILLAVGDGHGNAAVVSVVRIGFRIAAQAKAFEKVEAVPGIGDIRPLEVTAVLGLTDVSFTGHHYHPRPDKTAMVIAETDPATGQIDGPVLDALADVASYLPVR
jgi:hypothetical protein